MSRSPGSWDLPPVLPLGMRLTHLQTRNFSPHSITDSQPLYNSDFTGYSSRINNASPRLIEHQVLSGPTPRHWRIYENDAPPVKPIPVTTDSKTRIEKFEKFIKKHGFNLADRLERKTQNMYNCLNYKSKNGGRPINKHHVYYDLIQREKLRKTEHPVIEKFKRTYVNLQAPQVQNDDSSASSYFQNSTNASPFVELDFKTETGIQIPMNQNHDQRYLSPRTYSVNSENLMNQNHMANSISARAQREEKCLQFKREIPTVEDLIRHESSSARTMFSSQIQPTSKYYEHSPSNVDLNGRIDMHLTNYYTNTVTNSPSCTMNLQNSIHHQYSPKSLGDYSKGSSIFATDCGNLNCTSNDSFYCANLLAYDTKNIESDEDSITGELSVMSNSSTGDPVNGKFSNSVDDDCVVSKPKSDIHEFSFLPNQKPITRFECSHPTGYSPHFSPYSNENESQYSFYHQNTPEKAISPEPDYLGMEKLTPIYALPKFYSLSEDETETDEIFKNEEIV